MKSVVWTKSTTTSSQVKFSQQKINSLKYDEKIQKSPLSKTISAIAALFGADDPTGLPPYTSHNESMIKSFSTSETIDFNLQGRSTIPGEYAKHEIFFVPYLAREGAMMVAMAVQLKDLAVSPLWTDDSLYSQLPDPALLLPGKRKRNGASLVINDVAGDAMLLRGMRFYVPALDLDSDTNLLAGLTYTIRVPIYNASFVEADNFSVRLSYAPIDTPNADKKFKPSKPYDRSALLPIQTLTNIKVGGWSNAENKNKKWLDFTWTVPESADTGNYVFYVEIDPEHNLKEVHESRMDSAGKLLDSGGNNEGYFNFSITSLNDAVDLSARRNMTASMRAAAGRSTPVLSSRGTIYQAVSVSPSENAEGAVYSSTRGLDTLSIMSMFEEREGLDFEELLEVFRKGLSNGDDDADVLKAKDDETYSVVIDITYNGDEYYPEAYLCGYNYKNGTLTAGTGEVDHAYMDYRISLVPHTTTTVVVNLDKQYLDYINGTGFEIVVPELSGSEPEPEPEPEPESDNIIGSSGGGGCDSGFTALSLGILISALILRKKSQ